MAEAWFDARGCLNERGMTALRGAAPGAAAPEIAAHLAACANCQQRLLSLESVSAGRPRAEAKPPWRNLILLSAAIVLMMLAMVVTAIIVR
jgi:hypothetical protein